jgi:LysM repeat protein
MKRNRPFAALLVLIALLAAITACTRRWAEVEDLNATPVVRVEPTRTPDLALKENGTTIQLPLIVRNDGSQPLATPQVSETQVPSPEPSATTEVSMAEDHTPEPTPSPTPCTPPAGWVVYTVQPGDTLFRLALNYGMTATDLQNANCLPSADQIQAGQQIYVPEPPPTSIPSATSSPSPTSGVTPSPTHTPSITPSPTPTESEEISGVKGEIYFDLGGGNVVPVCGDPAPGITPQITISDRVDDAYQMCVFGFSIGEQITVELYAPDGNLVASKDHQVQADVVKIPLWMPVGTPIGNWSAIAESASNMVETSIVITPFEGPAINTAPMGEINPFENHKCEHYSPGENLMIRGTNFGASQNLPIGLYLWTPDAPLDEKGYILPLVDVELAVINQGDFSTQVTSPDPSGIYWVVPVLDPDEEIYERIDIKNDCFQVP